MAALDEPDLTLRLSKEEEAERLEAAQHRLLAVRLRLGGSSASRRAEDPLRAWTLTEEDWRNREKRPQYESAIEDMVRETSTGFDPWALVEVGSMRYARVTVIETVIAAAKDGLRRHGMDAP